MKLFFLILSITLTIQVSLAGPRDSFDDFQKGLEGLYKLLESVIPETEYMVQEALKNMPEEEEYNEYRDELKEYLEHVTDYKTNKGLCMEKTLSIVNHFDKFEDRYEEEDAPAEAKVVLNLFNENGYTEMSQKVLEWAMQYGKLEVIRHLTDPDTTNAIRMLPMALEVC